MARRVREQGSGFRLWPIQFVTVGEFDRAGRILKKHPKIRR
jgi:hypothetical protein